MPGFRPANKRKLTFRQNSNQNLKLQTPNTILNKTPTQNLRITIQLEFLALTLKLNQNYTQRQVTVPKSVAQILWLNIAIANMSIIRCRARDTNRKVVTVVHDHVKEQAYICRYNAGQSYNRNRGIQCVLYNVCDRRPSVNDIHRHLSSYYFQSRTTAHEVQPPLPSPIHPPPHPVRPKMPTFGSLTVLTKYWLERGMGKPI